MSENVLPKFVIYPMITLIRMVELRTLLVQFRTAGPGQPIGTWLVTEQQVQ